MKNLIVAEEQATLEVNEFLAKNYIDTDTSSMSEDDAEALEAQKALLIEAITQGKMKVGDKLELQLLAPIGEVTKVTISNPTAETMVKVSSRPDCPLEGVLMAGCQLTGHSYNTLKKLHPKDFKIVSAVINLFLA